MAITVVLILLALIVSCKEGEIYLSRVKYKKSINIIIEAFSRHLGKVSLLKMLKSFISLKLLLNEYSSNQHGDG